MTDDSAAEEVDGIGTFGLLGPLRTLLEEYGTADSPLAGLLINGGLAGFGLAIWYATSGLVAGAGLAWALVHLLAILKWVVESW